MKTKAIKSLIFFAIVAAAPPGFTQDFPTPIAGSPFSRPRGPNTSPGKGLSIEYERHPNYDMQTGFLEEDGKQTSRMEAKERFEGKIKIPLFLRGNWKVLAGLEYDFERYEFEEIQPPDNYFLQAIDGDYLKRAKGTFYIYRDILKSSYIAFRLENSYNGNFNGLVDFDNRYAIYRAAGAFGIRKNEKTDLAVGAMLNNNFQRALVLPFVIYDHTFSDHWGIETILPLKYSLRYNLSDKSLLLLSAEYWSMAYSVDVLTPGATMPDNYIFKSSAAQFFIDWQKNLLTSWTWISLRTGYSYNFDSKFILVKDQDVEVDAFPSNSVFVSLNFFLSPPRKD